MLELLFSMHLASCKCLNKLGGVESLGGWVALSAENKANSAQLGLGLSLATAVLVFVFHYSAQRWLFLLGNKYGSNIEQILL